jgi:lipoprotein-anchoring transpeptidase ErfK/SrfK
VKRTGLTALLAALVCAAGLLSAAAVAGPLARFVTTGTSTGPPATTETSGETTTLTEPVRIAAGVKIAGVPVGGMTAAEASTAVERAFARPLVFVLSRHWLHASPQRLGATADVKETVARAQLAAPGTTFRLHVQVKRETLYAYVAALARRFDRRPLDSRLLLRGLRPWLSPEVRGRTLNRLGAVRAIVAALVADRRGAVPLPVRSIAPATTRSNFGPIVVIRRGSNRLYFYNGMRFVRRFPIATGQAVYPTPLGHFQVVVKWRDPWWYPPASPWAAGSSPIPPGPGNPLGTRWMGLSAPGVGIHGTPNAASVGYSASHGCIRMYIPDAEWLFVHVRVGTPVFIVAA